MGQLMNANRCIFTQHILPDSSFQINVKCTHPCVYLCLSICHGKVSKQQQGWFTKAGESLTLPSHKHVFLHYMSTVTYKLTHTNTHRDEFVAMLLTYKYSDERPEIPQGKQQLLSLPTLTFKQKHKPIHEWQTTNFISPPNILYHFLQSHRKKTDNHSWQTDTGCSHNNKLLFPTSSWSLLKDSAEQRILRGFYPSKYRLSLALNMGEQAVWRRMGQMDKTGERMKKLIGRENCVRLEEKNRRRETKQKGSRKGCSGRVLPTSLKLSPCNSVNQLPGSQKKLQFMMPARNGPNMWQ